MIFLHNNNTITAVTLCQGKIKNIRKTSNCVTHFLLRCRMSVSSPDWHYAGAWLLAPYAAVHFPQVHVVFVHAVPLILPPNCWFVTSVAWRIAEPLQKEQNYNRTFLLSETNKMPKAPYLCFDSLQLCSQQFEVPLQTLYLKIPARQQSVSALEYGKRGFSVCM